MCFIQRFLEWCQTQIEILEPYTKPMSLTMDYSQYLSHLVCPNMCLTFHLVLLRRRTYTIPWCFSYRFFSMEYFSQGWRSLLNDEDECLLPCINVFKHHWTHKTLVGSFFMAGRNLYGLSWSVENSQLVWPYWCVGSRSQSHWIDNLACVSHILFRYWWSRATEFLFEYMSKTR